MGGSNVTHEHCTGLGMMLCMYVLLFYLMSSSIHDLYPDISHVCPQGDGHGKTVNFLHGHWCANIPITLTDWPWIWRFLTLILNMSLN